MSGLRSFRSKQSLDFTDLNLFAVVGDTGAGKSSILEAIVFALYAASTWDARGGGALMSLDADAMTITFDFSVGGRRYQVKRVVFRNSRPSEHALRSPDDPELRVAGERQVTNEIRRIVGLDYETFKKTVVLPQGRFAALLEMSETDRLKVLTDLLGLDEIDRLREKLEPVRREAVDRKRDVLARRGELALDPAAEAANQVEKERAVRAECDAMAAARADLSAKNAARIKASERIAAVDTVGREVAEMLLAAGAVQSLAPVDQCFQAESASLEERRERSKRELAAAGAALRELEVAARDAASLTGFAADVRRLRDDGAVLAAEGEALAEREGVLREEEASLEIANGALRTLRATADAEKSALGDSEKHRDDSREKLARGRDIWRAWMRACDAATEAQAECEKAQQAHREATAHRTAIEGNRAAAEAAYSAHRLLFEAAERAHRAAALAHEVHAGEACPVCRRTLPPDFDPPGAEGFTAEKQAYEQAERERDRARQDFQASDAVLTALAQRLAACEATLETKARARTDAEAAIRTAGLRPDAADEGEALQNLVVGEEDAARKLRSARERSAASEREVHAAEADVKARTRALAGALATHRTAAAAHRQRLARRQQLRADLPSEYCPSEAAEAPEYERILTAIEASRAHAASVAATKSALAEGAATLERELRDVEARYQRTVADVATERRYALDRSLAALGPSFGACDLTAPPVRGGDTFEALVRWCERLSAWCEQVCGDAADRRGQLSAEVAGLDAALSEILRRYGAATVDAFEALYVERSAQVAIAGERVRAARASAERAATLDRELLALQPVVSALEQLDKYLQNRAFKDFVMRRRERRLLGIGTEILRGMTSDRYAFAEGFTILDRHADQVRSAKTLSGGETFLSSLSLALALVEVASRTGGKLDALFLDEGFGNLDAAALDDALSELADRAKTGKMIGIVTHVRGIAEQIDTILRVERRATGSVVERLEGVALAAYMEDEVRSRLLGDAG